MYNVCVVTGRCKVLSQVTRLKISLFLPLLISLMHLMLVSETLLASENKSFENGSLIHSWGNPELGVIGKYAPSIEFKVSNSSNVILMQN